MPSVRRPYPAFLAHVGHVGPCFSYKPGIPPLPSTLEKHGPTWPNTGQRNFRLADLAYSKLIVLADSLPPTFAQFMGRG